MIVYTERKTHMKNMHIGVQLSTLMPTVREIGIYETLKQCAQMGIYHVEVSQLPMTSENVALLLKAKDEFNIQVSALSCLLVPAKESWGKLFDNLTENFDKIVSDCRSLGCDVVRIGMLPPEAVGSYEGAMTFAKMADAMGEKLKAEGIDLYFHTHHLEFTVHRGKTVLDILRDNTTHMGFELDIHWIQRGGCNPVNVIEQYKGRVRLLHLKDYRINGAKFEATGSSEDIIEYAEVGEGTLPIAECIEAGLRSGCELFYIEQDLTYDRTPLEALKLSYDNLVKMGYGEYFLP